MKKYKKIIIFIMVSIVIIAILPIIIGSKDEKKIKIISNENYVEVSAIPNDYLENEYNLNKIEEIQKKENLKELKTSSNEIRIETNNKNYNGTTSIIYLDGVLINNFEFTGESIKLPNSIGTYYIYIGYIYNSEETKFNDVYNNYLFKVKIQ